MQTDKRSRRKYGEEKEEEESISSKRKHTIFETVVFGKNQDLGILQVFKYPK